jgi:hypothetical protein
MSTLFRRTIQRAAPRLRSFASSAENAAKEAYYKQQAEHEAHAAGVYVRK